MYHTQIFKQFIAFSKQVGVVTNQLLKEGSETWDLSHLINIATGRPCLTTNLATVDNCLYFINLISIGSLTD